MMGKKKLICIQGDVLAAFFFFAHLHPSLVHLYQLIHAYTLMGHHFVHDLVEFDATFIARGSN